MSQQVQAVGIAWFREVDYTAARELFTDGTGLPLTHKDWLKEAEHLERRLLGQGHPVIRAYIDLTTFPAWCQARGLQIDSKARVAFANWSAYQVLSDGKGT